MADDGKPEPKAAEAARGARVLLAEAVKDVREELWGDTVAAIAHGEHHVVAFAGQAYAYEAAGVGELQRVPHQVPKHLTQPVGVAEKPPVFGFAYQRQAFGDGARALSGDGLFDQRFELHRCAAHL